MLDNLSTSYVPFRFCRRCSDNMALMCARLHSVAVRAAPSTMNDSIPKQFVSCSGVIAAPIGNSSISRDTFRMLATMDWRKPCLSSEEYQIVEWSWCSSTGTMYNWLDSEKETAREDLMLLEVVMIASLMSMQGSGIGVCRWIQIGNENYEILCPVICLVLVMSPPHSSLPRQTRINTISAIGSTTVHKGLKRDIIINKGLKRMQ